MSTSSSFTSSITQKVGGKTAKEASLNPKGKDILAILIFLGGLAFFITLINQPDRAWSCYLIGFFYFTSLALGGLFFTALQHITHAEWSVSLRRFSEALTAFLPYAFGMGVLFLLFGAEILYSWLIPSQVALDPLLQHKEPYLNSSFLWIRWLVFFGLWILLARFIVRPSLEQEGKGESYKAINLSAKVVKPSVLFIIFFGLSYFFFSVDALMSLEPHWFSTIFGVYTFSGLFQSTLAFLILLIVYQTRKNNELNAYINENHLHDLGKFLFSFTIFWAYIAFSQYMIIWYANLPEETIFFLPRSQGSWAYVSLSLLVFKFMVPFLALLPRWAKRNSTHLVAVSILILIMQYVDLYWLVYPYYSGEEVIFSFSEIFIFIGFLGLFLLSIHRFLHQNSLIPYKDPGLKKSMEHHVL